MRDKSHICAIMFNMIGRKIIFKETLDSTNNYAANLLERGELSHGTVIMSGQQTAGRGQRGTTWIADPYKNLIFTCFLDYDNLSVENQQAITHLVSLSLVGLLREKQIDAQIKWPNDIYIGGRKIAGILIENQLERNRCKSSIVGIGMNVNQTEFQGFQATSLKLETGNEHSIDGIALSLSAQLQQYYDILQRHGIETLKNQYLEKLWLKDVTASYEDAGGVFEGKITGIDVYGRLILERDGQIKIYDLKEIKFLGV